MKKARKGIDFGDFATTFFVFVQKLLTPRKKKNEKEQYPFSFLWLF